MTGGQVLSDVVYRGYTDALLAGEHRRCTETVRHLLDRGVGVRQLHTDLFQRSLYEIGSLWECNRISVAAEHMATSITEALLNQLLPHALGAEAVGRSAIVANVSPELHQVGARIVADTLEMAGWDAYFTGANTPTSELLRFLREMSPDLLALSLTVFFNIGQLEALLEAVLTEPDPPDIVIGGQGLVRAGPTLAARHAGVVYLKDLAALDQYLASRCGKP